MSTISKTKLPKDSGRQWVADAAAKWEEVEHDLNAYRELGIRLPAWEKPKHVARDVLGHYLLDRDTGVVHSVRHALPECDVDSIKNGTFVHFAHELAEHFPDAEACPRCLKG